MAAALGPSRSPPEEPARVAQRSRREDTVRIGGGSAIASATLTGDLLNADAGKVHVLSPSESSTAAPSWSAEPATARSARPPLSARIARRLDAAGALVPAALVLFFSFQAGGFFPGAPGVAACALAVVLALRATLARRPFASFTAPVAVVTGALAAYGAWILMSASWSHAPGRALTEFDRTLLYLLAFVACATLAWSPRRVAWAVRALVLAIFAVCLVGWTSRVAPDVVYLDPGGAADRLSQPLTYWNTQGLIAALGIVMAVHLASSAREPRWARALGAAAVPVLASTLFLTFSRGAILAALAGLVAYVVFYRSRGLLLGALAVLPPAAAALIFSYHADRLAKGDSLEAAATVAQGHGVAQAVALCTLAAALTSLAGTQWLHRPLHRVALPPRVRRPARAAAVVVALVVLVAVPLAVGAPAYVGRQYDRFVSGNTTPATDQRVRLLNPGNNGRLDHWRIALKEWRLHEVRGTGAGTFENSWNRERRTEFNVRDAHSIYLENLSELGVVGLGLLGLALGTLFAAVTWRGQRRLRDREQALDPSLYAAFAGAFVAWAVHAGLDWIWETPAVTVWVFALGGMLLTARVAPDAVAAPGRTARVAIGVGCLVLAVIPFEVVRSQRALDESVRAFESTPQNCPKAIDASLRSLGAVGARAEPWEIIAYCDVGAGESGLAVAAARNAIRRDPDKWTYRYALALVQGVDGQDPRPAARRALELNPRSQLARQAVKVFIRAKPRRWPAVARTLQLPNN